MPAKSRTHGARRSPDMPLWVRWSLERFALYLVTLVVSVFVLTCCAAALAVWVNLIGVP